MPEPVVFAIVLAAGTSSRFGSSKQLTEFDGDTFAARAVRLAESVCGELTVLVVGCEWQKVLAACTPLRGFFVRNDNYESGMAGSIGCAVKSVARGADAVLLLLADQPLISAEHLMNLIGDRRPDEVIVSEFAGVRGPPIIFPAQCFDKLMNLQGDRGARSILGDTELSVRGVRFDAAAIDIDTPEDFARLQRPRG